MTEKEKILKRHRARFLRNIGEKVVFKRPKRGAPAFVVLDIVEDPALVSWNGATPNYIYVEQLTRKNEEGPPIRLWTCENKLLQCGK